MSVYTVEEITITNENKAAKLAVEKLSKYLIKISRSKEFKNSLPSFSVLTIDGKTFEFDIITKDDKAYAAECTNNDEFKALVESLKNAHTIYFKTSHDIYSDGFGTEYWIPFLEENDTEDMRSCVVYKALSHDDCYDEIYTFKFSKDHIGAISFNAKREDLTGIKSWWCHDGYTSIHFEDEDKDEFNAPEEYRKEFLEFAKDFYAKFSVDKLMEFYVDFSIGDQFEVPFDKTDEFISYVQKVYDLSVKYNGDFRIDLKFIAMGEHEFAALWFYLDNGVIKCEYCNY